MSVPVMLSGRIEDAKKRSWSKVDTTNARNLSGGRKAWHHSLCKTVFVPGSNLPLLPNQDLGRLSFGASILSMYITL